MKHETVFSGLFIVKVSMTSAQLPDCGKKAFIGMASHSNQIVFLGVMGTHSLGSDSGEHDNHKTNIILDEFQFLHQFLLFFLFVRPLFEAKI